MTTAGLVAIAFGAMLGAWSRWGLSLLLNPLFPTLPLGTLAANLAGGYVIGALIEYLGQHPALPPELRLFAITGFLGSLTTFSTFSAESIGLLTRGEYMWALGHIVLHLVGSLLMTVLGLQTVRLLYN
ncbi:MAG TPA: fluoride efflux transporter CrcB [Burkholderiales bacterium]|nr:fluoride efflux transporter CrcB [Burkholderiales bacterium]